MINQEQSEMDNFHVVEYAETDCCNVAPDFDLNEESTLLVEKENQEPSRNKGNNLRNKGYNLRNPNNNLQKCAKSDLGPPPFLFT